ncbi:MAG: histone deacetylase [Bacteroidota bacterium]
MIRIFHSDAYVPPLPDGHRFPIAKYGLIREQLLYEGTVDEAHLEESYPVAEADILAVHAPEYWEAVRTLTVPARAMRRVGFPQSAQLVERARRSVQGTLSAARYALQYGAGLNIAGGTHHAFRERGEGFCLLNDLAITAAAMLRQGLERILIVDLDVHQGNGTAAMLADESRVFTFSMHGARNYPLHKESSDLDIGLPDGTGDASYLAAIQTHLPELMARIRPEIVLYQAGVDILASDRLGKLAVSREGCAERDRYVFRMAADTGTPIAVCMGGGYSHFLRDTVEGHAQTFRIAAEIFGT